MRLSMILPLLMLFGLAACLQAPQQKAGEMRMKGHVFRTDEGLAFQACDTETLHALRDETGERRLSRLLNELRYDEEDRIFVVFFGRPHGKELEAVVLEHAAQETAGCAETDDFLWKASGNEPFWSFRIGREETVVSRLAANIEERRFATPVRDIQDYLWVYRLQGPAGEEVVLELRRNPCRDSMAGHYFAYSAVLQMEGERLTGCARAGTALEDPGPDAHP